MSTNLSSNLADQAMDIILPTLLIFSQVQAKGPVMPDQRLILGRWIGWLATPLGCAARGVHTAISLFEHSLIYLNKSFL